MYKRILLADDLSEKALKVLEAAVKLTDHCGAKLYILNVRGDFLSKDEMVMLRVDLSNFMDNIKEKALAIKRKLDFDVKSAGGSELEVEVILREGQPGEVICAVAREFGADLIVVGTHGSSLLKDKLFGSTAHYVVNHARRPVLTVWNRE